MRRLVCFSALALIGAGCAHKSSPVQPALDSIDAAGLMQHTKVLASDEFEGRAPGTPGEQKSVDYLVERFKAMGLKPGNPDGTYIQNVPLVGITSKTEMSLKAGGLTLAMKPGVDYVAPSRRFSEEVKAGPSEIVFVGYGVVAPEYGWDDYKGVDVKGKTLLMLINDPAVPDESMFKGKAMTYYGRWTYKYEIASEKGAAAAIIVHETGPAGYPFEVVGGSWGRENFEIQRSDKNAGRVPVEGWITFDRAKELLKLAGQDLDQLKKAAITREFKPVPLKASAAFTVKNQVREVQSRNVVAKLEGGEKKDEYVIYSAHWDHLGRDAKLQGDQIFNGALDNAAGTAGLLEIAEAYAKLGAPPRRSILFLSVTAEEKGLLGAKYYAEQPLYPLNKTLANINMDGINQWGATKDLVIVGFGNTTLDDVAGEIAKERGRVLKADPESEKGFYYRSDHFELAKQGVPAFYPDGGTDFIGKPTDWGMGKRAEYTARDYHKVTDEVKPDWNLSGAAEDMKLLFELGYRVAQGDKWPEWKAGTEFKAKREASLR